MVAYFFFPTHSEMTQGNGICNEFQYGIFSQIGTVEQKKFVFKHDLYCQDAGNQKKQQALFRIALTLERMLDRFSDIYEKTKARNQAILTPIKNQKHPKYFYKNKQIVLILLLLCEVLLLCNSILSSDWLMPGCHSSYRCLADSR